MNEALHTRSAMKKPRHIRSGRKTAKKFICISIAFLIILAVCPVTPLNFVTRAETVPPLDASTGGALTYWTDINDPLNNDRYTSGGYTSANIGTSALTPYIIKNGDELAGVASLVNAGTNNFAGKYIDVQGLNASDITRIRNGGNNNTLQENTIDLSVYDGGTTGGVTNRVYWDPIGTASSPFNGCMFSSTDASIVNLIFVGDSMVASSTNYGLFNYVGAAGVIGDDGNSENGADGFSVTFFPDDNGVPMFNIPARTSASHGDINLKNLRYFGGLTSNNAGSVNNITVYGSYTLPSNNQTSYGGFKLGGIVGTNTGTIDGCVYQGDIYSPYECGNQSGSGIGGICGYTKNSITNCVANTNISFDVFGNGSRAGGIAGCLEGTDSTANVISGSVYSGSIHAESSSGSHYIGGICGRVDKGSLAECAASVDIYSYNLSTEASTKSYCGGIVGTDNDSAATITECFSIGVILAGDCGGIASSTTSPFTNCYSTCSIMRIIPKTKDDYSPFNAGGLVGSTSKAFTCRYNYYAGSTLNSNIGSILGYSSNASCVFPDTYWDKQLSPNRFCKSSKNWPKGTNIPVGTTASDICSKLNDATVWSNQTGHYPQLIWASGIDTSTVRGKLAKALSLLSSEIRLTLDANDCYTDSTGNYNAYQMKNSTIGSSSFSALSSSAAGVVISGAAWSEYKTFTGVNQNIQLGSVWDQDVTVTVGPITLKCVKFRKKLLAAVTQQNGLATSINNGQFQRFIDICSTASGGYIGGSFTINENITSPVVVKKMFDTGENDNKRCDNIFCCTLDGQNYTVSNVSFEPDALSMFGFAEEGTINDINFTSASVGNAAAPLDGSVSDVSFFFSSALNAYITDINITNAEVCISGGSAFNSATFCFGFLTANDQKNLTVSDVHFTNYTLHIGDYSTTGNFSNNKIGNIGGFIGSVSAEDTPTHTDGLTNCSIDNYDAFFDFSESKGVNYGCGGFVGDFIGWSSNGNKKNAQLGFINCHIKGDIISSVGASTSTNSGLFNTGGFVGVGENNIKFDNSSFEGNISSAGHAGGLVGKSNRSSSLGLRFSNTFVIANISSTPQKASLLTSASAGTFIGNSNATMSISTSFGIGNVTSGHTGGLVGVVAANSCSITDSYSKVIVTGKNTSSGLIGDCTSTSSTITVSNSYFCGQLKGDGIKSGIISSVAEGKYSLTNALFDSQICGDTIPTIASVTTTDSSIGAQLDAASSVDSTAITPAALSSNFVQANPATNYPEIESLVTSSDSYTASHSENSSLRIFIPANTAANLQSIPNFTLNENSAVYSVDRNTVQSGSLLPWNTVLNGPANNALYGNYTQNEKGYTTFTVKYSDYNSISSNTLDMVYDINVKPFDYGSGSVNDPYIIYNVNELIKYRNYLEAGSDTPTQYYKIGSVTGGTLINGSIIGGTIVGDPITLDLSTDSRTSTEWTPIINLSGNLDGNQSIIKNLNCNNGYTLYDENNNVIARYFGFYGSSNLSGNVHDLQLDTVNIATNCVDPKVGSFIGYSQGGTYERIVVTNSNITLNTGGKMGVVGGLIGNAIMTGDNQLILNQCMTDTNITRQNGTNGFGGGLLGTCSQSGNTSAVRNVVISECSVYGRLIDLRTVGGIIGQTSCATAVNSCVSTCDILNTTGFGYCGGIIGQFSTTNTTDLMLTDTLFGGRIQANYNTSANGNNDVGGIIGNIYYGSDVKLNSTSTPFASRSEVSFYGGESRFAAPSDYESYMNNRISQHFSNCWYNSDVNPYPSATTNLTFGAYYNIYDPDTEITTQSYVTVNNPVFYACTAGKSYTCSMTSASAASMLNDSTKWVVSQDYYPRAAWLNNYSLSANNAQWNKTQLNALAQFESLGIYYTNAAGFGDNTFSNLYFMASGPAWQSTPAGTLLTSNGRMLVSSGEGSAVSVVLGQTIDGYSFTKTINYVPSTVSCGVPDFSFLYANPNGMWITTSDTTSYPYTLYTADQLQGLSVFYDGGNNGTYTDGNGLILSKASVIPSAPAGLTSGETYILGQSIDCNLYDGEIWYKTVDGNVVGDVNGRLITANIRENFVPIGTGEAFNNSFSGTGNVIKNLHLSAMCAQNLGLFGTISGGGQVVDTGIVSGETDITAVTDDNSITHTVSTAGSIAAILAGNAAINNCFSAMPISGESQAASAGGIAGSSTGTGNNITNSFFTGYIFISGENSAAGGIAGTSSGLNVRSCYTAGYVEATSRDAVSPSADVNTSSVYYDLSAVGSVANIHYAANSGLSASSLGNKWSETNGLYPIQNCFVTSGVNTGDASAVIIPVNLTNARSVTSGNVTYNGANLYYVDSQYTGTVQDSNGNVYDSSTAFTSFEKAASGIAILKVTHNENSRPLIANLQCWYDAGLANNDVFIINTADELAEFALLVNGTLTSQINPNGLHTHDGQPVDFSGCTVMLGANIDMNDLSEGYSFVPAGTAAMPFRGTFDGDGYIISNISVTATNGNNAGLFGAIQNATVENVGLNGGTISSDTGTVGSIAATAQSSVINGCFSSANVTSGATVGGIVGNLASGTVSNSFNYGILSGTGYVGGIAGNNSGTITNCFNSGIISASVATAAGIAAQSSPGSTISNCYQASYVNAERYYSIASGGTVTGCFYDPQLCPAPYDSGSSAKTASGDSYTAVIDPANTEFGDIAEFAALRLLINGKAYNEFTGLSLVNSLADGTDVNLGQNPEGVFSFETSSGKWSIASIDSGSCYLISSVNHNGVPLDHSYFVTAVITTKIRYEFDFSTLLDVNVPNNGYITGTSAAATFNASGDTIVITSAADYSSFVSYVNSGGITQGKTFVLGADLDLSGQNFPPVGNDANPFAGIFDGRGHTISNLTLSNTGISAMFGNISSDGQVYNFVLDQLSVAVVKGNSDIYLAGIAAKNDGMISNIGIVGNLTAMNNYFSFDSYIGSLCAYNSGRIRGCYFIKSNSVIYGIDHVSAVLDSVGGLVGYNTGTLTGCYISSDLRVNLTNGVANIKALVGNNEGRTDNIINCYYNSGSDSAPVYMPYAYDNVTYDDYFVTLTMLKSPEFARWLSSNLYAGTFKQGSEQEIVDNGTADILNNGFPYLYMTVLSKYELADHLGETEKILLSIKNSSNVNTNYLNGIFTYQSSDYMYFQYNYYSSVITYDLIRYNVMLLDNSLDYTVTNTRVYGKNACFNNDVSAGANPQLNSGSTNAIDISNTVAGVYNISAAQYSNVTKPNLMVLTIAVTEKLDSSIPWGVYRTK